MEGVMLVKFPVCIVTDMRSSKDGQGQYITIIEPQGAEYQFSARPNDPEFPLDAIGRLRPFADSMDKCEIEADVRGFMWAGDGEKPKQVMTLRKLTVKPLAVGNSPAAK